MKFTKSYEPGEFEPQIYAEWEKAGVFQPREIVAESYEAETQDCYARHATTEREWKFAYWAWTDDCD